MRKRVKTLIRVLPDSGLGASDIALLISGVIVALIFCAMPDPGVGLGRLSQCRCGLTVVLYFTVYKYFTHKYT